MKLSKYLPILFLIITILLFFYPLSLYGKLPIPADTIVGLYHPFRDIYAKDYPRGIPFKNSLITDPVRQQYPWRFFSVHTEENFALPLWNPYSLAGSPLLANFQSASFYPLNILLLLPTFSKWWSLLILLQPLLAGIFMYFYLKEIKLNIYSCFLGGLTYAFCGFSIAWLEWGTIGHVALWLPLVLLCIDKIFYQFNKSVKPAGVSLQLAPKHLLKVSHLKNRSEAGYKPALAKLISQNYIWPLVFIFSLTSSFFAGHLQTFFYLFIISLLYFFARWLQFGRKNKPFLIFLLLNSCFLILTSIQWLPTLQLILQSARDVDQIPLQNEGWFLPTQHLIQFFAPDFFGNPTTLNYWGVWNYGEFIAYIGILPLIMACFALFYRYDKKTLFFGSIFFLSLLFALPSWFAKLPFELGIPFLNTAQPTRLLFLTDFALCILAVLGLDYFIRTKQKNKIIYPLVFIFLIYVALWFFVLNPQLKPSEVTTQNIDVAKNNLYIPTLIFCLSLATILLSLLIKRKNLQIVFLSILICLTLLDLFRFAYKFTPFSDEKYLYPRVSSLSALYKHSGISRVMTTDSRILPPNFSVMYHIQSIDGYDPLYLRRYGELIVAMERNAPDINPPFGFNRIITPHNYDSRIADLLGVKYVLSLTDLSSPKLRKVYEEGQTKIYENKNSYERVFFVDRIYDSSSKEDSINAMFDKNIDLKHTAVVEDWNYNKNIFKNQDNKAEVAKYRNNEIIIKTSSSDEGFLVLTDTFYPTWHAKICETSQNNCKETKIYRTDYNFRGIIVPAGENNIVFYITML